MSKARTKLFQFKLNFDSQNLCDMTDKNFDNFFFVSITYQILTWKMFMRGHIFEKVFEQSLYGQGDDQEQNFYNIFL